MSQHRLPQISALVFAAALSWMPGHAAAQTDAPDKDAIAMGLMLAHTYCADCHAIAETGDSPFPAAPPFRNLPDLYDLDQLDRVLTEGLVTAHPDMPEFEFDPHQARAIVIYLKTLSPQ